MHAIALAILLATATATDAQRDSVRHAEYMQLVATAERSASPRDWALAATTLDYGDPMGDSTKESRAALLRKAAESAPKDRLVQWLWAKGDDVSSGCTVSRPCPERRLAVAKLEPGNAAAWLLGFPNKTADPKEIDAALHQLAGLDRYSDGAAEFWQAWTDFHRSYPAPAVRGQPSAPQDPEMLAITLSMVDVGMNFVPNESIFPLCNRMLQPLSPDSRFEDCGRIGKLMFAGATTPLTEGLGIMLQRVAAEDAKPFVQAQRKHDWRSHQFQQLSTTWGSNPEPIRAFYRDLVETGSEIRAEELMISRAGVHLVPPPDWKAPDRGH